MADKHTPAEEMAREFCSNTPRINKESGVVFYERLVKAFTKALGGKRNAVVKEYKDEGAMFVLKVEDGKTYEASMPIPKWVEVSSVKFRG